MRTRRLAREEEATLVEHLEELRGRIMVALATVGVATAVAFVFHDRILDLLARPLPPAHRHVAAFGVAEPFSVSLSVSLYAGLLFAVPVLLWQAWSFLAPALDHFRLLVRASSYYSFVVSVLLGVVCVFELPLVVLVLVGLGVLTSAGLRRNRRKGYFFVAVAALALPGPDPITTLLELLPMWALFEGSIWLAVLAERRAAKMSLVGARA